jgi:hypothetical protein
MFKITTTGFEDVGDVFKEQYLAAIKSTMLEAAIDAARERQLLEPWEVRLTGPFRGDGNIQFYDAVCVKDSGDARIERFEELGRVERDEINRAVEKVRAAIAEYDAVERPDTNNIDGLADALRAWATLDKTVYRALVPGMDGGPVFGLSLELRRSGRWHHLALARIREIMAGDHEDVVDMPTGSSAALDECPDGHRHQDGAADSMGVGRCLPESDV